MASQSTLLGFLKRRRAEPGPAGRAGGGGPAAGTDTAPGQASPRSEAEPAGREAAQAPQPLADQGQSEPGRQGSQEGAGPSPRCGAARQGSGPQQHFSHFLVYDFEATCAKVATGVRHGMSRIVRATCVTARIVSTSKIHLVKGLL